MVMKTYSVAKGKAKAVTMIMSSMNDPQPSAESDARFIEELVKYWKAGGQVAFYFVDQLRIEEIEEKTGNGFFDCFYEAFNFYYTQWL